MPGLVSKDTLSAAASFLEFKLKTQQGTGSVCIANVDYDEFTQELTIVFQERGTYKYGGVPLSEVAGLLGASSKGTYFNLYIRDRYSFERVG